MDSRRFSVWRELIGPAANKFLPLDSVNLYITCIVRMHAVEKAQFSWKFGWLQQNAWESTLIFLFHAEQVEILFGGKYKVACPNFHKLMVFNFHMAMIASTCPHKFAGYEWRKVAAK